MPAYWLFKSEPDVFSIHDLKAAPGKKTSWEGIRNYQARNFLRDTVRKGDGVLFYHSNADPMGIAGTAVVARESYADHFAFDPDHRYFDPDSSADNPTWFMVDIRLQTVFASVITREMLANDPICSHMLVLKRGSRLSIQPVTPEEWQAVLRLAENLAPG
jgi:predicted RNA-binding protein with PUA-like domain